jgi:hypothetical protein
MSGLRKYGIYILWNLIQPQRSLKFCCLPFAGKWLELKNIILSEVSQVQKAKGHLYLICGR